MTPKTLKALKGSINKWKAIVAGEATDHGTDDCPLCKLFYKNSNDCCQGCPVMKHTGLPDCRDTPYYETRWARNTSDYIPLATKMLRFLVSLLPKKSKSRKPTKKRPT